MAARDKVEDALKPRDIVLCTGAGAESRNLQLCNQIMVYNIPFGILRLIQLIGRVARMDSKFIHQDIHFLEASGTIDTYKRVLAQDAAWLYSELFGENDALPTMNKLDRNLIVDIRKKLLWGFRSRKGQKEASMNDLTSVPGS